MAVTKLTTDRMLAQITSQIEALEEDTADMSSRVGDLEEDTADMSNRIEALKEDTAGHSAKFDQFTEADQVFYASNEKKEKETEEKFKKLEDEVVSMKRTIDALLLSMNLLYRLSADRVE